MDKIQLGEFVKSLDKDLDVKEGKQFAEINVPSDKLYSLAKQLKENEETLI